uniref:NADH-ubiquinone oxidoreductase chain 5 n=1 Tax=Maesaipsyche stengeli TaxID=2904894 RepID=A0A9E8LNJ8_9NEOP|nr:NADH dehydrogenase subunit 5 [Maesaipsyche stengeli]UZZ43656.1 NADH dehydrogenase subunit 5 [Maesaipsyche stengeli]
MFKKSICLLYSGISLFFSFIMLLLGVYFLMKKLTILIEWELISYNTFSMMMIFYFDWISLFFSFLVLLISAMVLFFSKSYMGSELNLKRFIYLVLMFILSMMFMIFSLNLISILLGWDGLGLVSFCLVIFYQNVNSFNSGMLTVLSNRVGDVMILIGIIWMFNFGSWNFLNYLDIFYSDWVMSMVMSFIIFASMTKSAQIPFSAWLPAAMAAPTPVSALVHSSTLVTAGVYLMIRFGSIILFAWLVDFLLLMSSLTMLMAGLSANMEVDLKKIIALSTLSQLGLMMSILCLGFKYLAFFHLLTHAMFKAMLFMCAGLMIHSFNNNQDIRLMGNTSKFMPLVSINFNVSNLALCGMPFLTGFYSKDMILEMVLSMNLNLLIFFFFFFSTGLTVSYSVRLMYFSLFNFINNKSLFIYDDNDYVMINSKFILLIGSVIGGSMLSWLIFPYPYSLNLFGYKKFIIMMVLMMGVMMGGLFFSLSKIYVLKFSLKMNLFVTMMWFLPFISSNSLSIFGLSKSNLLLKLLDYGWLEKFGGQCIYNYIHSMSNLNYVVQLSFFKIFIFCFYFLFYLMMILNLLI